MSALGSSVINKSGKKFVPKPPARRPAAPVSTQTSARPSVDRQVQSQTPQPQSITQRVAASPTPSTPLRAPASTQHSVTTTQANHQEQDAGTSIIDPLQGTTAPRRSSPPSVVPQKRLSEPQQSSPQRTPVSQNIETDQTSEATAPTLTVNKPNLLVSNLNPTNSHPHATQNEGSVLAAKNQSRTAAALNSHAVSSTRAVRNDTTAPAVKRRRIGRTTAEGPPARRSNSNADANTPLPSTETNEVVAEASTSAEARAALGHPAEAKRPRVSAKARRKQQIDKVAARIVDDATRSPLAHRKKPRETTKGKRVGKGQTGVPEAIAPAIPESSEAAEQCPAPPKTKRTYAKKKSKQSLEDAAAGIVEDAVKGSSKNPAKRGRRSKRAATPDGADIIIISTSEVRMADLCKDGRTGRKSEREKELAEHERAEIVRKKQRQLQEIMGQAEPEGRATPAESADGRLERLERQRREESVALHVPNTIIVDGQIRIDEDSLQIDRHAAAAIERAAEQLEAIDETDLSRKVNSGSWLERDRSGGWNESLTERFYDGLRMFGTDFEMISKMFPGRTRHKIKLKFVKEEKVNYDKIRATLLGQPIPVDLPEFEKMAGTEFDDPQELERDMSEDRKRLEEETAAEKQAMNDALREREEQIAAERAAAIADENSSSKENRGRKDKEKKGERRKQSDLRRKDKQVKRSGTAGGDSVVRDLGEARGAENQA